MAYNANIDYRALQDALRKQKETETGTVKQSQLQSQIDTAEQSRTDTTIWYGTRTTTRMA